MEPIVNITVAQTVNHNTTVAESQGSVWEDVNLDGKNHNVITVGMINILFSQENCIRNK